jgi:hypothetical protein
MGFIDRPFTDMAVPASTPVLTVARTSAQRCHAPCSFRSCRSSRLQRFAPQRSDPKIGPSTACGFVAPRSRSWGSPRFGRPGGLAALRDPKVCLLRRPQWRGPFEAFPSPAARPVRHRFPPPRGGFCVHRLACPLAVRSTPCRVTTARNAIRPQGFLPPKSPLRACGVATPRRSMLPWALDRSRPDACHASPRRVVSHPFRPAAPTPRGRPTARERCGRPSFSASSGSEGGRCMLPTRRSTARRSGSLAARRLLRFRSARSGTGPVGIGRLAVRVRDAEAPKIRHRLPRRAPKDPNGHQWNRGIHRAGPFHPKVLGLRLRRGRPEGRTTTPAHSPGGLAPVVRAHDVPPHRYPKVRTRWRVTRHRRRHTRRCGLVGAPPVRLPKEVASNPPRVPRRDRVAGALAPEGARRVAPAASPASWRGPASGQTDIVSTRNGRVAIRRSRLPSARRPPSRRSRVGGAVVSAQSHRWGASPSRLHRSARAGMDRSPLWATRAEARLAFVRGPAEAVPRTPTGVRSGDGVERVDVHVKERFRRRFSR